MRHPGLDGEPCGPRSCGQGPQFSCLLPSLLIQASVPVSMKSISYQSSQAALGFPVSHPPSGGCTPKRATRRGPNISLEPLYGTLLSARCLVRHKWGLDHLQGRPQDLGLFAVGLALIKTKSLTSRWPP